MDNHRAAEGEFKIKRHENGFVQLLPLEEEASCWNTSARRSGTQMDATASRVKSIRSPSRLPCPLSLAELGEAHTAAPHRMGKARDVPPRRAPRAGSAAPCGSSCGQGCGPAPMMLPGLPHCAGDVLCNVCFQCNSPGSSRATLFETEEETARL